MTTEIKRDHEGRLHLFSHGVPVPGATVTGVKMLTSGDIAAEVYIPTRNLTFAEMDNVVPFVRPERS